MGLFKRRIKTNAELPIAQIDTQALDSMMSDRVNSFNNQIQEANNQWRINNEENQKALQLGPIEAFDFESLLLQSNERINNTPSKHLRTHLTTLPITSKPKQLPVSINTKSAQPVRPVLSNTDRTLPQEKPFNKNYTNVWNNVQAQGRRWPMPKTPNRVNKQKQNSPGFMTRVKNFFSGQSVNRDNTHAMQRLRQNVENGGRRW